MPKYRPDRHIFPQDGSKPEKAPRWEQLIAWEIVQCIATGERPRVARIKPLVPPERIFRAGESWAGQNLTALGTVAHALAGLIPPDRVREMYFSQRTGPPEPPGNEGMSINYGNYQVVAAVGGLELGGEAAEESVRKLRRDLAWWMLWSTPDGKVIAPAGREYSAAYPEHAQEIVRALLGLPSVRPWGHQWWAGTWAYSAQLFAVEGSFLNRSLFTAEERAAFHHWRGFRTLTPPFAALLSELRAPEGARWELRAWKDGSHAGVVSGLRPYIAGPNGMIPAVVSVPPHPPEVVWTDHHRDGKFFGYRDVVVEGVGAKKFLGDHPAGRPDATLALDGQGLTVNEERIAPVRDLPALAPWEPSRVGVEGDPAGDKPGPKPEPEPPPEEPEEEEPAPKPDPREVLPGLDVALMRRRLEHIRDDKSKSRPRREKLAAHDALRLLDYLGAWD